MRKISLITTMAFSTLVFAALLSCIPIPVVHAAYPDPVNACMCDHWNEEQHDTEYDIFTATGVTAYYSSPQTFDHADFWFSCGTGGYYMYHPSYLWVATGNTLRACGVGSVHTTTHIMGAILTHTIHGKARMITTGENILQGTILAGLVM